MNDDIQHFISGKTKVMFGADIQAFLGYLRASKATSSLVKANKQF